MDSPQNAISQADHFAEVAGTRQNGWLVFRPRSDPGAARFLYDPVGASWLIQTPDGLSWTLDARDTDPADPSRTYAWYATRVKDTSQNEIKFTYDTDSGALYLTRIEGAHPNSSCAPYISVEWAANALAVQPSYRKGWRTVLNARNLSAIEVGAPNEACIMRTRRYTASYSTSDGRAYFTAFAPQDLPPTSFEYTPKPTLFSTAEVKPCIDCELGYRYAKTVIMYIMGSDGGGNVAFQVSSEHTTTADWSLFVDIDGDGDLDQVQVGPPSLSGPPRPSWRENSAGSAGVSTALSVRQEGSLSTGALNCLGSRTDTTVDSEKQLYGEGYVTATRGRLIDVTGDGKADLVCSSVTTATLGGLHQIYVCPGQGDGTFGYPAGDACRVWGTGRLGLQWRRKAEKEYSYKLADLRDMNGDGRPDLLVVEGRDLVYYPNTGQSFSTTSVRLTLGTLCPGPGTNISSQEACIGATRNTCLGVINSSLSFGARECVTVEADLIDMNGDGLPDHTHMLGSSIVIAFNKGDAFEGMSTAFVQDAQLGSRWWRSLEKPDPWWPQLTVHKYIESASRALVADVDADGIPDLLTFQGGSYYWRRGIGNGAFEDAAVLQLPSTLYVAEGLQVSRSLYWGEPMDFSNASGCDPNVPRECVSGGEYASDSDVSLLLDYDGDGRLDALESVNGTWVVHKTVAPPGGRLKGVASAAFRDDISYGPPEFVTAKTPGPRWVVKQIDRTDNSDNSQSSAIYHFRDPIRSTDGSLLSFQEVIVEEGGLGAGRYLRRRFLTGEYSAGKLESEAVFDSFPGDQDPLKETLWEYENVWFCWTGAPTLESCAGVEARAAWTRPTKSRVRTANSGAFVTTAKRFEYFGLSAWETDWALTKSMVAEGFEGSPTAKHRVQRHEYFKHLDLSLDPTSGPFIIRERSREILDGGGNRVSKTSFKYDSECPTGMALRGLVCEETKWRGSGLSDATVAFVYDELGRNYQQTDPDGVQTTRDYWGSYPFRKREWKDPALASYYSDYDGLSGAAGKVCGPQHAGSPEQDNCRVYERDLYGRLKREYRTLHVGLPGALGGAPQLVRELFYSDATALRTVTEKRCPDPVYGEMPQQEQRLSFNRYGKVIGVAKYHQGVWWTHTRFTYDLLGRLSKAWPAEHLASSTYVAPSGPAAHFPGQKHYEYQHDDLGRLVSIVRPDGTGSTATYHGAQVDVVDPAGATVSYLLNGFGEVERASRGSGVEAEQRTYAWDAAGRLASATDGEGGVSTYTYYGTGKRRTVSLPVGEWRYTRTPAGRLARTETDAGDEVIISFDALGRPRDKEVISGGECGEGTAEPIVFVYNYDEMTTALGWLTSVDAPSFRKTFEYDAQGRKTRTSIEEFDTGASMVVREQRSAFGDVISRTGPSGQAVRFSYAGGGVVERAVVPGLVDFEVSYDADGQVAALGGIVGDASLTQEREYTRELRQPKRVTNTLNGVSGLLEYTYNDDGKIATMEDALRSVAYSYGYDTVGRLNMATGYAAGAFEYAYNKNSTLKWVESPTAGRVDYTYLESIKQRVVAGVGDSDSFTIQYDSVGRQCASTSETSDRQYRWNGDGTLAQVVESGSTPTWVLFDYDENGKRWRVRSEAGTVIYLGDKAEMETRGGDYRIREYFDVAGVRTEVEGSTAVIHLMDLRGVMASMTGEGEIKATKTYEPYGKPIVLSGEGSDIPFGFNAKRSVDGTGLLYFGARYYDPRTGVFLSVDPARLEGAKDTITGGNTLAPYVFGNGDPVGYSDPDGRVGLTNLIADLVQKTNPSLAAQMRSRTMEKLDAVVVVGLVWILTKTAPPVGPSGGLVLAGGLTTSALAGNILRGAILKEAAGLALLASTTPAEGQGAQEGQWTVPAAAANKVPAAWGSGRPDKKGEGHRWQDPNHKGNGVRIDKGNPSNPQPSQQVDHVVVRSGGKVLGRDGKAIEGAIKDDPIAAHIPLSEWMTWSSWNAP